MHRLKRPDAHLRVYLRALHAPVAQHRLYPPQVCPVLQHLRRHRVSELVTASFVDACGSQVRHYGHRDAARRQARHAVHRQEQRLTVGRDQHLRPHVVQISCQLPQRTLGHRHHLVFLSLTLYDSPRSRCPASPPRRGGCPLTTAAPSPPGHVYTLPPLSSGD